jgi:hypothetical protein
MQMRINFSCNSTTEGPLCLLRLLRINSQLVINVAYEKTYLLNHYTLLELPLKS